MVSVVQRIRTLDAHAEGEPLRVIVEGWPEPEGDTILAKRAYARRHQDALRRALMLEPRGHADMYGALPTRPVTPDGDLGVLFLHNEGFSTMCGHGIIGLTKVALDRGLVPDAANRTRLRYDTPAGRVDAWAERGEDGRVRSVTLRNVPSFVASRGGQVEVEGLSPVTYDLAYGGAFYAYVDAEPLGLSLVPESASELVRAGRAIKRAVMAVETPHHPDGDPDLGFLYGVIFCGPAAEPTNHSRHVCVFAEGEVDRSPTGTGVSARAALLHASGELATDEWITIESILGSSFDVKVGEETRVGSGAAVVPWVRGTAHLTGEHTFLLDPDDPFAHGFFLR